MNHSMTWYTQMFPVHSMPLQPGRGRTDTPLTPSSTTSETAVLALYLIAQVCILLHCFYFHCCLFPGSCDACIAFQISIYFNTFSFGCTVRWYVSAWERRKSREVVSKDINKVPNTLIITENQYQTNGCVYHSSTQYPIPPCLSPCGARVWAHKATLISLAHLHPVPHALCGCLYQACKLAVA